MDHCRLARTNEAVPTAYTCAVIDDDPDWLLLVRRALRLAGSNVALSEFEDAEVALSHLSRQPVDIVVSDVRMPRMDGPTFVREFRQFNSQTPVVLVSSEMLAPEDALACGADALVRKRDLNQGFVRTLEDLVESSRARADAARG